MAKEWLWSLLAIRLRTGAGTISKLYENELCGSHFFDLQTLSEKFLNSHSLLISSSNGNSLIFSILPFKSYIIQVSYVTFVVTVEGRFLLGILVLCFFHLLFGYGFQNHINV